MIIINILPFDKMSFLNVLFIDALPMYRYQTDTSFRYGIYVYTFRISVISTMMYHILLNECTVRVEFGKIFCRRGVVEHPYSRTPQ